MLSSAAEYYARAGSRARATLMMLKIDYYRQREYYYSIVDNESAQMTSAAAPFSFLFGRQ